MPEPQLPVISPPGPIYRIGRRPDPWVPIDWAYAGDDLTFGNRFDDSEGYFRVLYAASKPLGCFIETLARYRSAPTVDLIAALQEIENAEPDYIAPGTVPASWLAKRMIGVATAGKNKRYADIYSSAGLAYLRKTFGRGSLAKRMKSKQDFDLALLMSQDRTLTQQISTHIYQLGYDGIYYPSRHGHDLFNWALFEPFDLQFVSAREVNTDNLDLTTALEHLALRLDASL